MSIATATALAAGLAACEAGAPEVAGPVVDTLPNGAVRVANPADGLWAEGEAWVLVEDLRLGSLEGEGPEVFGQIADLEVDRAGRIYVLDRQAFEVRIFGPDGSHLATFGRQGEGPGELKQPQGLELGPAGRVWIVDVGNQRYAVIDSAGGLVEERRRFTGGFVFPWPGTVLVDGRVIDVDFAFEDGTPTRTYTLWSPGGELLDTVPVPADEGATFTHTSENSRTSVSVPFAPQLERTWDPGGGMWFGLPDRYRVVRTDLEGDTTRVVERAWDPVPVTAAELEEALGNLEWFREQGGAVDRSRIPDHHPAYHELHADRSGHLWVVPVVPWAEEGPEGDDEDADEIPAWVRPGVFDVFDPDGRYLGRVSTDVRLARPVITGTHLVAVTLDELGVSYVVRFRIEGR